MTHCQDQVTPRTIRAMVGHFILEGTWAGDTRLQQALTSQSQRHNGHNRPYAYDVTEGRPPALGVKWGTATCVIAKHAARGQPLHATPPGWPAWARALRGWVPMRTASTTRAPLRDTSLASLLWRCDPLWRQCIRSIHSARNAHMYDCFSAHSTWLLFLPILTPRVSKSHNFMVKVQFFFVLNP